MSTHSQVSEQQAHNHALEEERRELEAVAATLSNSSRLLRLLTYIGDKYFLGETDKFNEYNIATDVFGRSRSTFDPGEDAIVRVEAHRLRKKLKEFYDNEGRDHAVRLALPPGSYAPVFTHSEQPPQKEQPPPAADLPPPPQPQPRWRAYLAIAAVLCLVGVVIFALAYRNRIRKGPVAAATPASSSPARPAVGPYARIPLRILAGYSGKPQIDDSGNVWLPDEYYHDGVSWTRPETDGPVERNNNPMIFKHWRGGSFYYKIPLQKGDYELHLYFVSSNPNANTPPTFGVAINGKIVLAGFDPNTDAMGPNIPDERVFRGVQPSQNGFLYIDFYGETAQAALNGIEILPGLPHSQLPVRIVTQPASFTDNSGNIWHRDEFYQGGYGSDQQFTVTGAKNPGLYASERYGYFSYSIPVDARDQYTLVLHFVESYFGPKRPGGGGVGSRLFRVTCNGQTLLDNFDIFKQAGSLHALTETFHHLKPTPQGKLNIIFDPIQNNATVSAIEVLDESN